MSQSPLPSKLNNHVLCMCVCVVRHRFSAPPGPDRSSGVGIRDSVGSMDYLSESQVDSDDEESAQSEVTYCLPLHGGPLCHLIK